MLQEAGDRPWEARALKSKWRTLLDAGQEELAVATLESALTIERSLAAAGKEQPLKPLPR
jgi:hypothetical protein